MTPPERSRRRRRRRGPRQHVDGNQEQGAVQHAATGAEAGSQVAATPEPQRPQIRQDTGQQADGQGGGARKRARAKRRPNRQPMLGPMPSEVLKPPFRKARPTRQMERLLLDEVLASERESVQFGCPMLTRTRLPLPSAGNVPSPRCSMGWALHSEDEVALCLRTPDLLDCWKLDGQREERLRAEMVQESAAD